MNFKLFKPQNWWIRSSEARSRNCAVLPYHATFFKSILKLGLYIIIIDKIRYQRTLASVDKGIHGFSRGKTTASVVILVGGRQPACLVCLAVRRLSSVKNSGGLAERSGTSSARQRTTAYWRMSRTITQQTAGQSRSQASMPLLTDAKERRLP